MSDREQQQTEELLRAVAKGLRATFDEHLAERVEFTVLVFPSGRPGRANYISSARREDMIKSLRETATRLEHGMIDPPGDRINPQEN